MRLADPYPVYSLRLHDRFTITACGIGDAKFVVGRQRHARTPLLMFRCSGHRLRSKQLMNSVAQAQE